MQRITFLLVVCSTVAYAMSIPVPESETTRRKAIIEEEKPITLFALEFEGVSEDAVEESVRKVRQYVDEIDIQISEDGGYSNYGGGFNNYNRYNDGYYGGGYQTGGFVYDY